MLAVNMRAITKRFGAMTANDQIDFQVEQGEIHCLLGENGAEDIRQRSAGGEGIARWGGDACGGHD